MNSEKQLLSKLKSKEIIIDGHAILRAKQRDINLENLLEKLKDEKINKIFIIDPPHPKNKERYQCRFKKNHRTTYKTFIIINKYIELKSVMKINNKLQKKVDRYGKI
ncbi:MAG: hypothetical protein WC356_00490 [Candidatus Micrarchaeia archaeon]|jgi:hypothetical protein